MNKLLTSDDMPPLRVENATGKSSCVIVCDHAGTAIPRRLGDLGLSADALEKHRHSDPGADEAAIYLGRLLDAPVILGSYSRLVVDLNRDPQSPDSWSCTRTGVEIPGNITEKIDGIVIPANAGLSAKDRELRLTEIFAPYHRKIDEAMSARERPVLISIHSFAPVLGQAQRPWDIGVMWYEDQRLAHPMIESLKKNNPGLVIGDNEPYSLQEENVWDWNYTTRIHAEEKGLPNLLIEYNQGRIDTAAKARKMAEITAQTLKTVLEKNGFCQAA